MDCPRPSGSLGVRILFVCHMGTVKESKCCPLCITVSSFELEAGWSEGGTLQKPLVRKDRIADTLASLRTDWQRTLSLSTAWQKTASLFSGRPERTVPLLVQPDRKLTVSVALTENCQHGYSLTRKGFVAAWSGPANLGTAWQQTAGLNTATQRAGNLCKPHRMLLTSVKLSRDWQLQYSSKETYQPRTP
jgi:hypothetical protein